MITVKDSFFIDSGDLLPSSFPKKIEDCDLTNPVIQRIQEWVLSDDCPINQKYPISIEFFAEASSEDHYLPKDLIYRINVTGTDEKKRTVFIVKNFGDGAYGRMLEIENLKKIHAFINSPNNAENKFFQRDLKLPKIAWCERIVKFCEHYIGIFHCAPGESMWNTMRKTKVLNEKNEIYFQFGVSLGHFHLKFAEKKDAILPDQMQNLKTLVHGDLHLKNVFYDRDKKEFWFIDYEHFGVSLETPETIKKEIDRIEPEMLEKYFVYFIDGYSSCFPLEFRTEIKKMSFSS